MAEQIKKYHTKQMYSSQQLHLPDNEVQNYLFTLIFALQSNNKCCEVLFFFNKESISLYFVKSQEAAIL